MDITQGAAHSAPTQSGAGLNPADGLAYGLPYPTAAKGRNVSRYSKRMWQKKMEKKVQEAAKRLLWMSTGDYR